MTAGKPSGEAPRVSYPLTEDRKRYWLDYVVIAAGFLILGSLLTKWEQDRNVYQWDDPKGVIKVLQRFDAYRFLMRFPKDKTRWASPGYRDFSDDAKYENYEVWFCKNYHPCLPFPGLVLTSLRYEDNGDCWDIKPLGLGYNFLQDEAGNDIDEHGKVVFDALKDSCQ